MSLGIYMSNTSLNKPPETSAMTSHVEEQACPASNQTGSGVSGLQRRKRGKLIPSREGVLMQESASPQRK